MSTWSGALSPSATTLSNVRRSELDGCRPARRASSGRFAARVSGLASGLALAVRPAGLAEVSRVKGESRLILYTVASLPQDSPPASAGEAGATLRELMDRMGHASTRAALIYQHRTTRRDKIIADEISKRAEAELKRSGTKRARGKKEALMMSSLIISEHSTLPARSLLERVTGIEPALSAWEADVLPLNYTRASPDVAT